MIVTQSKMSLGRNHGTFMTVPQKKMTGPFGLKASSSASKHMFLRKDHPQCFATVTEMKESKPLITLKRKSRVLTRNCTPERPHTAMMPENVLSNHNDNA